MFIYHTLPEFKTSWKPQLDTTHVLSWQSYTQKGDIFHEEVHVYISYSKEQQILECKVNGLIVALVKYGEFFLLLYTILLLLHYSLQTLPKGLHLFSN